MNALEFLFARSSTWFADVNALTLWGARLSLAASGPVRDGKALDGSDLPRAYIVNNVGIVPVGGPLLKTASAFEKAAGFASYAALRNDIADVLGQGVKGIVLVFDSPGGSFSGLPEAVDCVAAAAKRVRVEAMIDGCCTSAALWLASPAAKISASKSSQVGSIGAAITHLSVRRSLEASGIDATVICDPPGKSTAHPFKQLTDADAAALQARVSEYSGQFRDSVLSFRPGLSREALNGQTFSAQRAKSLGLIDEIGTSIGETIKSLSNGSAAASAPAKGFVAICRELHQKGATKSEAICAAVKQHPAAHAAWLKSVATGKSIFN